MLFFLFLVFSVTNTLGAPKNETNKKFLLTSSCQPNNKQNTNGKCASSLWRTPPSVTILKNNILVKKLEAQKLKDKN